MQIDHDTESINSNSKTLIMLLPARCPNDSVPTPLHLHESNKRDGIPDNKTEDLYHDHCIFSWFGANGRVASTTNERVSANFIWAPGVIIGVKRWN